MKILKNKASRSISLILEFMKINTGTNFENPRYKILDLKVKSVLLLENSSWVKFYSGLPQNTPKVKQFSSLAKLCLLSKCPVEITEKKMEVLA